MEYHLVTLVLRDIMIEADIKLTKLTLPFDSFSLYSWVMFSSYSDAPGRSLRYL